MSADREAAREWLRRGDLPANIAEAIGLYLATAETIGRRTGELHVALASADGPTHFSIEPYTPEDLIATVNRMREHAAEQLRLLDHAMPRLDDRRRQLALDLLEHRQDFTDQFHAITRLRSGASRIRCHGDYHLGQVLIAEADVVILDFEGEPARPLVERREKCSPLRDVAGMIRSFEYAAAYGLLQGPTRAEDAPALAPWARLWRRWASARFLQGYLGVASGAGFLPPNPDDLRAMLELYLIDKTVYELRYELNNRPDWVGIPLQALLRRAEPEGARMVGAAT